MFCHHCDDSLAGHRYVLRDDHPYCIKCYENVFANNCDECGKIIGIDSKVSVYLVDVFFGDIFMKMYSSYVFLQGICIGNRANCNKIFLSLIFTVLFRVGKFKSYVSCSGFLHSKDILIVVYPILIHTYPAVSPKNRDCTFIKKV